MKIKPHDIADGLLSLTVQTLQLERKVRSDFSVTGMNVKSKTVNYEKAVGKSKGPSVETSKGLEDETLKIRRSERAPEENKEIL